METIASVMTDDHRRCDALFAQAEARASKREWRIARELYAEFRAAAENHFGIEEQLLFPAFERQTGTPQGPTSVMRQEHAQMRGLFEEMERSLRSEDLEGYLGLSETLHIMTQQHNLKEEQILYPMTDRALSAERDALLAELQQARSRPGVADSAIAGD